MTRCFIESQTERATSDSQSSGSWLTSIDAVRFVVLDSETTGLNPRVDRLITIGAVAVQNSEIVVEDSFDALIRIDRNTEAVTVHGVTRDQSLRGMDEAVALEQSSTTSGTA